MSACFRNLPLCSQVCNHLYRQLMMGLFSLSYCLTSLSVIWLVFSGGMGRVALSFKILLAFWFRPASASSQIRAPWVSTSQHNDHVLYVFSIHSVPLDAAAVRVLGFLSFLCKFITKPGSALHSWIRELVGLHFPFCWFLFALPSSKNANAPSVTLLCQMFSTSVKG